MDQFSNSEKTENIVVYAGFWQRFLAAFIDGTMLFVLGYLLQKIFGIHEVNFIDSSYVENVE